MTRQEVRQALADAANTVRGINCSPNFRQTTRAGDGMVRFDHLSRSDAGIGFVNTWQVAVALPQDVGQAEEFIDSNIPALVEALGEEMVVTRVTPAQLALENGTLPVVFIEGVREE